MKKRLYYIAVKDGELPRVAKYYTSLIEVQKNGFTVSQGELPKQYVYIAMKRR